MQMNYMNISSKNSFEWNDMMAEIYFKTIREEEKRVSRGVDKIKLAMSRQLLKLGNENINVHYTFLPTF